MYSTDVGLFEKLVYHDIERGVDSTGVMTFRGGVVEVHKTAQCGDEYLRDKRWVAFKNKMAPVSANSATMAVQFGSVYVGHNRAATRGTVIDENAHPFQHGHITLVHNGTLTDQSLLPESSRFAVDSDNIAYAISVEGIDATIQKLKGAYTLVWIDSSDETLHIIRNSQRPFHLLEKTCGDWFGASEEDMLLWVLSRQKGFSKTTVKRHFECEVGTEYVFSITGKRMVLREERKHTLPTFPVVTTSSRSYDSYDDYYDQRWNRYRPQSSTTSAGKTQGASGSKTTETQKFAPITHNKVGYDNLLAAEGYSFRVDNEIEFWPTEFDGYGPRSLYGRLDGFTYDGTKSLSVVCHNVPTAFWEMIDGDDSVELVGTLKSMSRVKGELVAYLQHPKVVQEKSAEKTDKFRGENALAKSETKEKGFVNRRTLFNGTAIGYEDFCEISRRQAQKCPVCDDWIMWGDMDSCILNAAGLLIHHDCKIEVEEDEEEYAAAMQFNNATFADGSRVTRHEWDMRIIHQDGVCPVCGEALDWDDAEECQFYHDNVTIMHKACDSFLDAPEENTGTLEHGSNDTFLCDVCKEFRPTKMLHAEGSAALRLDVCSCCVAMAIGIAEAEDEKSNELIVEVPVFIGGTECSKMMSFTEKEWDKVIQGMGSQRVDFKDLPDAQVRITKLGTNQFRYFKEGRQILSLKKKLTNGITVTKALWNQSVNNCYSCRRVIPWRDAETMTFDGLGHKICPECTEKGKKK